MPRGRVNAYLCRDCRGYTMTVDVDEGVTPFMLRCRAEGEHGDCGGKAQSLFYRLPPALPEPAWEFYRPDEAELATLDRASRAHVQQGGLLLRAKRP